MIVAVVWIVRELHPVERGVEWTGEEPEHLIVRADLLDEGALDVGHHRRVIAVGGALVEEEGEVDENEVEEVEEG